MRFNILDILQEFGKKNRYLVILICILIIILFGEIDYIIGYEISFSIFYLIPISISTLALGRYYGIIFSFLCAIIWLEADLFSGAKFSNYLIPYWNALVRFGFFILHTFFLHYLQFLMKEQKKLSLIDPLTGAANWRYFREFAIKEIHRAQRYEKPLTMAYFDIDNLKQLNDSLGHSAGDKLLKLISELIKAQLRPGDMLARVGGDEFVILLSEAKYEDANIVLNRIMKSILIEIKKHGWVTTLSIGAVTYTFFPLSIEEMLKKSDELMYEVKNSGKNNLKHIKWEENP